MLFYSKGYPTADVLIALQAHELFILFGKGINILKFQNIDCNQRIVLAFLL